jgi:hypothetical protein
MVEIESRAFWLYVGATFIALNLVWKAIGWVAGRIRR